MTDVDDFLAEIHPRLVAELRVLHNGDPQPRLAMWSTKDPVTLLADERQRMGAGEPDLPLDRVSFTAPPSASRSSPPGSAATWPTLNTTSVSIDGIPVEPYTLRVTQVYRREDGEWKAVHRHGTARSTRARTFPAKHRRRRRDATRTSGPPVGRAGACPLSPSARQGAARSAASRTSLASISTSEAGFWPAGHGHTKASGRVGAGPTASGGTASRARSRRPRGSTGTAGRAARSRSCGASTAGRC